MKPVSEEQRTSRLLRRLFVTAAVWVFLGIVVVVLLPRVLRPSGLTYRAGCLNNLRQIGLSMVQYAGDHDGQYPPSLGMLMKTGYLTTGKVFICPSSGNRVPEGFPWLLKEADLERLNSVESWGSYVMAKDVRRMGDPNVIVVYETKGAHGGKGRGCLFDDGHTEWLPEAEFQERIREQDARLHELSLLRPEGEDVRLACMSRIRKIGLALFSYADEHEGRFPESWGALLQGRYLLYPASLFCPAAGHTALPDFPRDAKTAQPAVLRKADAFSDYVLVKGMTHNDDADLIIVHEKQAFVGQGRCCLFNDGHVEYLTEAEFQERMAAQEAEIGERERKHVE